MITVDGGLAHKLDSNYYCMRIRKTDLFLSAGQVLTKGPVQIRLALL